MFRLCLRLVLLPPVLVMLVSLAILLGKNRTHRELIYFIRSLENSGLYTLALEQGLVVRLLDNPISPNHLAILNLAPDQHRIVFTRSTNTGNSDLFLLDIRARAAPRRLTNYPTIDTDPIWSPDGRYIVFVSTRSYDDNLYMLDTSGDDIDNGRLLSAQPSANTDYAPAWSPDGRYIAYTSHRSGNYDIYIVDVNDESAPEVRLTDHPTSDLEPAWSPDGMQIAFVSRRDGNANIYVVPSDGSEAPRRLTIGLFNVYGPTWSPDGQYLAFAAKTDLDGNLTNDIYAVRVADGHLIRITQHPANDNTPIWSPDGEMIAFISWRDGTADVYGVRLDKPLEAVRLTQSIENTASFVWR